MLDNDHVKHIVGEKAEYLVFPELEKYPELGAAFAIRGAKSYHYEPISPEVDYSGIASELGVSVDDLIMPFQAHTDVVAEYDDAVRKFKDTDGLVTAKRGAVLCTKVADCISLLMYDPIHHAIANIHSGWRGTLKRIAPKTVQKMTVEYGSKPEDLIIVLCPSIGPDHFEVKEDVAEPFRKAFGDRYPLISDTSENRIRIDLWKSNRLLLEDQGVRKIEVGEICTVCHKDEWFSHRGDHGKSGRYGVLIRVNG